ncbi:MAG: ABC transporter permease [Acidobacteriota bacterium]
MINLRLAVRSLGQTPVLTGVAVLSLALGIGATAALFSLFERVLLRPLPVQKPQELVNLSAPGPKPGSNSSNIAGGQEKILSYPMFRDLQGAETALSGIAGHRTFGANIAIEGETVSSAGLMVSGNYFEVLGLQPAAGRLLSTADDVTPGAHPVVVLAHNFWRQRLASNPSVVGKPIVVNGQTMTIIGVAPEGFGGTSLGSVPRIFLPISMRQAVNPQFDGLEDRRTYWVYAFGRLAPGASIELAKTSLNVFYSRVIQDVEMPLHTDLYEETQALFKAKQLELEPGARGQSVLHREARDPLVLLLGVTAFVLLIAAANLANLLLVRATDRATEIAVRLSIGARRHQVMAQLLAEALLLSTLGGLAGLLVAQGTLSFLASVLPEYALGFRPEVGPMVLLLLAGLTLLTSLAGVFPALHSTRKGLVTSLRSASGQTSGSRLALRFRSTMATLQIALSMTLLVSAGLFLRSLVNVSKVDLGIEIEQLATFSVSPVRNGYSSERSKAFFATLEERIGALPGVVGVAGSQVALVTGSNWGTNVGVQGFEDGPNVDNHANYSEISPGFFATVGITMLAGRDFRESDTLDAPQVAIVNEAFARKFGLGREAVGKRMSVGTGGDLDKEIVGIVEDSTYSEVKDEARPLFFMPHRQNAQIGFLTFYVRTVNPPGDILTTLRALVAELDPNLPISDLRSMRAQVEENVFIDRVLSTLSAAFALLATLLAAIGLYGVLAYSVAQRRREIGLRMALGANSARVRGLVLRQVGLMTLVGTVIGLSAALGLGRVAQSLLYGLEGSDPLVLVASTVLLTVVATLAGLVPAERAARIEPMRALRDE